MGDKAKLGDWRDNQQRGSRVMSVAPGVQGGQFPVDPGLAAAPDISIFIAVFVAP
jgi:hypothetical protein